MLFPTCRLTLALTRSRDKLDGLLKLADRLTAYSASQSHRTAPWLAGFWGLCLEDHMSGSRQGQYILWFASFHDCWRTKRYTIPITDHHHWGAFPALKTTYLNMYQEPTCINSWAVSSKLCMTLSLISLPPVCLSSLGSLWCALPWDSWDSETTSPKTKYCYSLYQRVSMKYQYKYIYLYINFHFNSLTIDIDSRTHTLVKPYKRQQSMYLLFQY